MKIFLENVNLKSRSGPNSFANKLVKHLYIHKHAVTNNLKEADVRLCFIESRLKDKTPLIQRLDGIYFNTLHNYKDQNSVIKRTYNSSFGVIFQSEFNKKLTTKYFGEHDNGVVIHNGADLSLINETKPLVHSRISEYDNVWCCASSWRPHKRLEDNINYFLEHSEKDDCLVVAGKAEIKNKENRIIYVGELTQKQLISLYKASKYFIHLAWLDHCPNVVVDARASGCQVICSSTGGTKEIAGTDAIVIQEEEWDMRPTRLYEPPKMNFSNKIDNVYDSDYDMNKVAKKYSNFLKATKNAN